jgi:hypothetical protein
MFTLTPEVQEKFGVRVFYTVLFVVFAFLDIYSRLWCTTKQNHQPK